MKLLFENWRQFLSEEEISVEDIHKRADELEIPWDDNAEFMAWTKELTGKSHLDDMTSEELSKIYAALENRGDKKRTINTKEELIDFIRQEPNQKMFLDNPKGTTKKFGGVEPRVLPFDYGEYTELINPADNMGWDFLLTPSSSEQDENLLPVGHISYKDDEELWDEKERPMPPDVGDNHKLILSQDGEINGEDKDLIINFFSDLWQFREPEWYGGGNE